MQNNYSINLSDIDRARQRIAPLVRRTYLIESPALTRASGANVLLKLENLQVTGSFKPRGVANRLLNLSAAERQRGVIAVSTGNHGRAVAYMARRLHMSSVVCISQNVQEYKRKAIEELGAEVVTGGETYDEAVGTMGVLAAERGHIAIRSFEETDITAGHGTIGLELLEDLPEVDTVLVPLASGGLLIGIATAVKAGNPHARIVGVAMEHGALLVQSLMAGKIVDFVEEPTLADALMGGLGAEPEAIFNIVRPFVDEAVTVNEKQIAEAITFALEEHHQVIEGAAAVGIAALLNGKVKCLGQQAAVVITGGNIDLPVLLNVVKNVSHYH
jgi:threonine dehydratase